MTDPMNEHPALALNPRGHLVWEPSGGEPWPVPEAAERLAKALEAGAPVALLHLASREYDTPLPAAPAFWREFARRYLAALCHVPESEIAARPVAFPDSEPWEALIDRAPQMRGLEYLTPGVLLNLWTALDDHARATATAHPGGAEEYLRSLHPIWRMVGRVCFHLAENKKNETHPFAFLATYASGVGVHGQVQYRPLGQALREYAGEKNRDALIKLLSPVKAASEKSALARELLDSGGLYRPLAWTPRHAFRFLQEILLIEAGGVMVRLPDFWKGSRPPRPQVSVSIGGTKKSGIGLDALLSYQAEVALNGVALTPEEIKKLLAATDGLALIRGQWVEADPEKLKQALAYWEQAQRESPDGLSLAESLRLLSGLGADAAAGGGKAVSEWVGLKPGAWLEETLAALRDPARLAALGEIPGLRAELRPYQKVGVAWMAFMRELGLGACLADDMGLGKTVQVLALLLRERAPDSGGVRRPSLLVAPASLLSNWKAEIERFTPGIRHCILHPSEMPPEDWKRIQADPVACLASCDLALTTYSLAARWPRLREIEWDLVALDEAQAIKNPGARQTRAVKELRARHRLALTGTPIENRLGDLWSLFDFLNPGLLGSARQFGALAKKTDDPAVIGAIRSVARPYILRRMKTDRRVIADLPEKTEIKAFCGLTKIQAALYEKAVRDLSAQIEATDGMKRRGLILAFIVRFKQICNHPSHWLRDGQYDPAASGKFQRLAELVAEIAARQEKALVFTQFREITDALASYLAGLFQRPGLILHGGTPIADRRGLVQAFQREDGPPFFVLTVKAGGSGLNLTEASHVIHFDRWWNPAVENQATDRAFRIGQKKNVLVHKFICKGTIEERIDAMIGEKIALARDILEGAGTEKMLTEMDNKELLRFVSLDIGRAMPTGE